MINFLLLYIKFMFVLVVDLGVGSGLRKVGKKGKKVKKSDLDFDGFFKNVKEYW